MIKKLICWLWGHDFLSKDYGDKDAIEQSIRTGGTWYRWTKVDYCLRCGVKL